MSNSKTSQGFAKVSVGPMKYVIAVVVVLIFVTASFNFGSQIFSNEGVEVAPGTDLSFTVEEGTSIKEFGKTLKDYNVIKDARVFRIQAAVYGVKYIEPGTYTFNTSQGGEEILKTISAGPGGEEETTQE